MQAAKIKMHRRDAPPTQFPLILELVGEAVPETWPESAPADDSGAVFVSRPLAFCSWDDPEDAGCFFACSEHPETTKRNEETIKEISKLFILTWGRIFFLQSNPQNYFSQWDSPGTSNKAPRVKRL